MTTPNLGFALPTEAQAQKTLTIANALSDLDRATQGDTALTITGNTAVTEAEFTLGFSLELTGTPGSPFNLTVPSTKRFFRVENGSDADATVKTASGTTVVVVAGDFRLLYCDGANITEEGGGGGGGGSDLAIEDEGSEILSAATRIDFKGAGVTAVNDGGNQAGVTIPGVESLEGGSSKVTGTSALDFDADHFDITDGGGGTTDIALADQSLETKVNRITTDQSIGASLTQIQWNNEVRDEFAGHDNSTNNERIVIGAETVDAMCKVGLLTLEADAVTTLRIVRYNSSDVLQEVVASWQAEEADFITTQAINIRGAAGDYLVADIDSTDTGFEVDLTASFFLVRRAIGGGGGGAGTEPTRTTVTLSGSSVSQSIPAGCTWFKYISAAIVASDGSTLMAAQIYNTGDTVIQLFAGLTYTVSGASVVVGSFTNSGDVAFCSDESTSTGRGMSGTVFSPRDAAKKTLYEGRGYNDAGNVIRHLEGFAVDADDDDTIRFLTTVGTFTGSVEIEWYYN